MLDNTKEWLYINLSILTIIGILVYDVINKKIDKDDCIKILGDNRIWKVTANNFNKAYEVTYYNEYGEWNRIYYGKELKLIKKVDCKDFQFE